MWKWQTNQWHLAGSSKLYLITPGMNEKNEKNSCLPSQLLVCCWCRFCFIVSIYFWSHMDKVHWVCHLLEHGYFKKCLWSDLGPVIGDKAVTTFLGGPGDTFSGPSPGLWCLLGHLCLDWSSPTSTPSCPLGLPSVLISCSPACTGQSNGVASLTLRSVSRLIFNAVF